nr:helix-turn-helix domain-containing protein [Silvibacterium dinghuense]
MSLTDLCLEFGISRPMAYRWINRYKKWARKVFSISVVGRTVAHTQQQTKW